MKNRFCRREFMKFTAAATAWPLVLKSSPAAETKQATKPAPDESLGLTTLQVGPQIWVRWNNRLLTSYRAHRSQKYPYLYPLAGPVSGLSLTDETALPWPHHRSLFFACDRVNGGNYWHEEFERGQIISAGPKLGKATRESLEILDSCDWQKPGGPVVMSDQRRITVRIPSERLRFIDWEIEWRARENVVIQKTNHSLFSVRAAVDITPIGGGNLVNAEGETGEKGTFGKRSAWCGFFGKRGGAVEGIAIFDHPRNPWSPCPWFTRDYGFISPTPFFFTENPWQLAAGKSLTLRYRVVLHAGDPKEAGLSRLYQEWNA